MYNVAGKRLIWGPHRNIISTGHRAASYQSRSKV